MTARLTALVLLLAAGCARRPNEPAPLVPRDVAPRRVRPAARRPPPSKPKGRGTITIAGRSHAPTWRVELAIDDADRMRGLMFRRSLPDDAGMLFFMPYDRDWAFYMRNTYVALDMVFVAADWTVVGVVANTTPLTETLRRVGKPSRYVLELNAHQARSNGIRPGSRLVFRRVREGRSP